MKDGIITGTGNSRYLKGAGWPATYAEFKAMAEAGTLPFDLNGINEAGWQQIGDALNKGNLLSDVACDLLDIPTESVPNDAFSKLALGIGKYGYAVIVKDAHGVGIPAVTINGLTTPLGTICITDSEGMALGASSNTNVNISFAHNFIDLEPIPSRTVQSTGIVTSISVIVARKEIQSTTFTSSATFRFSPSVRSYSVSCCGAGGGGGDAPGVSAGGGGGGGMILQLDALTPTTDSYTVIVPAGGSHGSAGGDALLKDGSSTILTAIGGGAGGVGGSSSNVGGSGGNGGSGNGNGGKGGTRSGNGAISSTAPTSGTNRVYVSELIPSGGGGGGGGGVYQDYGTTVTANGASGGTNSGAKGGNTATVGGTGLLPGGGGGGAGASAGSGGAGGAGIVALKWRYE